MGRVAVSTAAVAMYVPLGRVQHGRCVCVMRGMVREEREMSISFVSVLRQRSRQKTWRNEGVTSVKTAINRRNKLKHVGEVAIGYVECHRVGHSEIWPSAPHTAVL